MIMAKVWRPTQGMIKCTQEPVRERANGKDLVVLDPSVGIRMLRTGQ